MNDAPPYVIEERVRKQMLEILKDGKAHTKQELHACCGPSSISIVSDHISQMRKKLNPAGQNIICVLKNRRIMYQQIRLLANWD